MADTSFTANATRIRATWLQKVNDWIWKGRNALYATSTGTATAYKVTLPATSLYSTLTAGDEFTFKAHAENTGVATLQISGASDLTAKNLYLGGAALTGGEIEVGDIVKVVYDGTQFQIVGGTAFKRQLALSTGSSLVGYMPSGSVQSRTVSAKLQERPSLFDYIPPGLHAAIVARTSAEDVSSYILDAIEELDADGGLIECIPGRYYVPQAVASTNNNIHFWGRGKGSHGINAPPVEFYTDQSNIIFDFGSASATNHSGPKFENIGFTDTGGVSAGAIRLRRMNHARFFDVSVRNFTAGYGVLMDGTGDAIILPYFIGINFRNNLIGIRSAGQLIGPTFLGGYILGPGTGTAGGIGIDWNSSGADNLMILNTGVESYETAVKVQGDAATIAGRFEGNTTHVQLESGGSHQVVGSTFVGGTTGIDVNTTGMVVIGPNKYPATQPSTPIDIISTNLTHVVNEPSLLDWRIRRGQNSNTPIESVIRQTNGANDRHAQFAAEANSGAAKAVMRASLSSGGANQVAIGSASNASVNFIRNESVIAGLATAGFFIGGSGTAISAHYSATASLDFGNTTSGSATDLTVTVTGAVVGDIATLGIHNSSIATGACGFYAWVSAADTVTVRFWNASGSDKNPSAGTFRVDVWRH